MMGTSDSSSFTGSVTISTSGTCWFGYTTQPVDYCSLLAQPDTRLIADIGGYDDPLWILACPQNDNDWNEWKVAYNKAAVGDDDDEWVVHRTVWWWGEYTDWAEDYTEWFVMPMLMRADSEVEPAFVWN